MEENTVLLSDATKDLLAGDNKVGEKSHSQPPKEAGNPELRRENDSLDDFEHLEHDLSPVKGSSDEKTDLVSISSDGQPPRVAMPQEINTIVGSVAVPQQNVDNDYLKSDSHKTTSDLIDTVMNTVADKIEDIATEVVKTEKTEIADLLGDLSYPPPIPPHAEPLTKPIQDINNAFGDFENFKQASQNFMDTEREFIAPAASAAMASIPKFTHDLADRFSDSEPEIDDFKQSSNEEFTIPKDEQPIEDFFQPTKITDSPIKETFKDVIEETEPEVPQRDYYEPEPSPVREIPKISEPVKEVLKTEPVMVEPVVEPVCKLPKKVTTETEKKEVIAAEAMFCKMGLDAWFNPDRLDPKVESLIYWRDPKKSGIVFGGILVILLSLAYFSLISVTAYLSLLSLAGTISFRIYKNVLQAVQKTSDGHPFKEFLEADLTLPQDKVKEVTEVAVTHVNAAITELRRLFLVEDLVDSIKFGVLLWCLTYLGAWFNGMTIIIIAFVALFTLPKVYENNKTQIDANLDIVKTKLAEITSKVKAAIPIGKKTEEKKDQ